MSRRLLEWTSAALEARTSRRGFLTRVAITGSAMTVAPVRFLLRPVSAYEAVCGSESTCDEGYTVFCCTINNGANACPPGSFVAGWWKVDGSEFCCGGARYYLDCNGFCTCDCEGESFCPGCFNCGCTCASGTCDERRVCCNVFRYGQCHNEIGCCGPVVCRVVTCTAPWQYDPTCSAVSATDYATASHSAPCLPGACASAIEQHYYDLGGPRSFLGRPLGPESSTPDGTGRFQHFQGGSIYWHPASGAWEVHGAIRDKWSAMGWEKSALRYPTTDERKTPDNIARFNHFQGGSIYWHPNIGAREVHGAIRDKWAASGWERGALGYPMTDEGKTPDGVGRFNHFQGGSIYWHPSIGAREVHGAIRLKWAELGWERCPFLGYPTTDELPAPDGLGRFNHFQGGSIYWHPRTGANELHGAIRDKWAALGWERSPLGYPTTDEQESADGVGHFNEFQRGTIHWTPETGAHEVHGAIFTRWDSLDREDGALGYPLTDEQDTPDRQGRYNRFQHGTITWDRRTGETTVAYDSGGGVLPF